jgi:uncharacterized OsmC-like protein
MKNGISVTGLSEFAHEARSCPEEAKVSYDVSLAWETATRLRAAARSMDVGTHRVARTFRWSVDEPHQILGTNHAPTPQEYLLSGLGACLAVSFLVGATTRGVRLESLEVDVSGDLDLRRFMGLDREGADPSVGPGFEEIRYRIRVRGDASPEVLEEIHRDAVEHSPNAQTIVRATALAGELEVEEMAAALTM